MTCVSLKPFMIVHILCRLNEALEKTKGAYLTRKGKEGGLLQGGGESCLMICVGGVVVGEGGGVEKV